jgi:hypothetical protein
MTIALNHTIVLGGGTTLHATFRARPFGFSASCRAAARYLSRGAGHMFIMRPYTLGTRHCHRCSHRRSSSNMLSVHPDEVRPQTNGIQKRSIQNPMPPRRNPLSAFEQ